MLLYIETNVLERRMRYMADKLYYKDEDYDTDGFFSDEEYDDIEPVVAPVELPSGRKRVDLGDKLPEIGKKERSETNVKTTNRKNGRKK